MSKKVKQIVLIAIALLILVGVGFMSLPFVVGMSYGYDSAMIENKIKDNCNCKTVELDKEHATSEKIKEKSSSGRIVKTFKLNMKDCDYSSFEDLKKDVLASVENEELCSEKIIELTVDYSDETRTIEISNCIIQK